MNVKRLTEKVHAFINILEGGTKMLWIRYIVMIFFAVTACDLIFFQLIEIYHAFIHVIHNRQQLK